MEPGFDDDDLIEDYIEDSYELPPGYDDEYLEEMMVENGKQSGETAAGVSSGATQTQENTTENSSSKNGTSDLIDAMMQQEEEEEYDDDEIAERSANVTQAYAKRSEGKKNLYTFERYAYTHPHWMFRLFRARLAIQKLTRGAFLILHLLCFDFSQVQPK